MDAEPSTAAMDAAAGVTARDHALVSEWFDAFDSAFLTFDGDVIAERYATPYLACRADGSAETFADRDAIATYFQRIVDGYRHQGVRSCTHRDLVVDTIGAHLVGSVTWDLLDAQRDAITSWRESYVLVQRDGALLSRASIDHPPSAP